LKKLEGQAYRTVLSQHLGRRFQRALATRAHLSTTTIQRILQRGGPSAAVLRSITAVLGCEDWELLKEVRDVMVEAASKALDKCVPTSADNGQCERKVQLK